MKIGARNGRRRELLSGINAVKMRREYEIDKSEGRRKIEAGVGIGLVVKIEEKACIIRFGFKHGTVDEMSKLEKTEEVSVGDERDVKWGRSLYLNSDVRRVNELIFYGTVDDGLNSGLKESVREGGRGGRGH